MEHDIVSDIYRCLGILLGESKQEVTLCSLKGKDNAFFRQIKENVSLVHKEIQSLPELRQFLSEYLRKKLLEDEVAQGYWNFVEWCLILIQLLSDSLKKQFFQNETLNSTNVHGIILSISQQKTVEKCVQFIVALGLLPNLLPGVGQTLKKRSEFADMVECIETVIFPQTKHRRLVICLKVLLNCTMETTLQSIIITHHAGDLLASLFQLCYAPIKRIHGYTPNDCNWKEDSCSVFHVTSHENAKYVSCKNNLKFMLENAVDKSLISDIELISEMLHDQQHFFLCLNDLLKRICLPILMWELLLQGSPKSRINNGQTKLKKAPLWLSKICNDLLIKKILEPQGVKSFVHVVLDKVSDSEPMKTTFDEKKINAVARLVSGIPICENDIERFMESVSNQVIEILHSRGSLMDSAFGSVASVIILHFIQNYPALAEKYILKKLFKAFWKCLDFEGINQHCEYMLIVNEKDLSICIEDTYQIFVENGRAISQRHDQLLPFFRLLFKIFSDIQNGVSYLRPKVFGLLTTIINEVSMEEAIDLMNHACFDDLDTKLVHLVTGLKCISGENGGIAIVHEIKKSPEEVFAVLNIKYQAANALLNEASHTDVKMSFFLNMLKKLKDLITKEKYEDVDIQNSFVILQFLQELVEVLGEGLVKRTTDILFFVNEFLNHGIEACSIENCDRLFGSESLIFALIILDTFVGYKNQLSSLDWKAIKQCIPCLRKLSEGTKTNDSMQEMSKNLLATILTHGAILYDHQGRFEPLHCTNSLEVKDFKGKFKEEHFKRTGMKSSEKCSIGDVEHLNFLQNFKKGSDASNNCTDYDIALGELGDPLLPVRGHGLIRLTHLIAKRNKEALSHKDELLEIFKDNIADEDSYIYLAAIQGLSALADISTDDVLPVLLNAFINTSDHKWQQQLKIGEVLMKVARNLGEMTVKYQNNLVNAFLHGSKNKYAEIRMSSLSNLAEVCQQLKWSVQSVFYEVLHCIDSVLKTDKDVGVRRSAASVLTSMLKGMKKDDILMTGFMKELYSRIKNIYHNDKDEIVRLHAQVAREEIKRIIQELTFKNEKLVKEIRVLDPL